MKLNETVVVLIVVIAVGAFLAVKKTKTDSEGGNTLVASSSSEKIAFDTTNLTSEGEKNGTLIWRTQDGDEVGLYFFERRPDIAASLDRPGAELLPPTDERERRRHDRGRSHEARWL